MKIAIASDHAGLEYKKELSEVLNALGYEVQDFGTNSLESCDYPDYAFKTSKSIEENVNQRAILICGSGVGMSITANKVKGCRAANCFNPEMVKLSRQHNNANILTIASRFITMDVAKAMVKIFLETDFEGGRHQRRVDKIHKLTGC